MSRKRQSVLGVLFFLSVIGVLVLLNVIPIFVVFIYLIASVMTFVVYAYDKYAAQKGKWRVRESTLHMLALLGGWPGALIAQVSLRHKTIKQPFQKVFWGSVILNGAALIVYVLSSI